jgi:hypothetical protein
MRTYPHYITNDAKSRANQSRAALAYARAYRIALGRPCNSHWNVAEEMYRVAKRAGLSVATLNEIEARATAYVASARGGE